ncbi:MAG TPA: HEAT repeat domain-containing protein [Planctomycetota bacterium]|nr:HEAT repeat domain-containing protein [Planctomycetota bacterium]
MNRETALRELSQGNPDLQRRALRILGRWDDDQVLKALIGALQSPHRAIREAATDTLLEIGDARTVRLLLPLLRSSVPAIRNSARQLLQQLAKAAPEILIDLSRDPDVRMRVFAANIMTESGDHDLAQPLLDMLTDADENVRDAAVVGLGRLGAPEAIHRLEEFSSHGESWSRFSAIDALSQIPSSEAVRALSRLLKSVPAELQEPVVEALGRQASPEAAGPLLEKLFETPSLGSVIIPVLAQIPAAATVGRMSSSDRPFLATAIAERLLQNGLAPEVTVGLIDLLGELGVRVAGSVFIRGLASPQRRIQQAAIHAVLKLGLTEMVPMLRQVQSQGDPLLSDEIQVAVEALSKSGKERA